MGFLIRHDYDQLIKSDELDIIIDGNDHILDEAMRSTQSEIESYLRDRYDVALMFFNVVLYKITDQFNVGTIIALIADDWKKNSAHLVGDLVAFVTDDDDLIFRCILDTTSNQEPTDATYWRQIGVNDTLYTVTVDALDKDPNDAGFYDPKDSRDPHLVRMFIDLLLYEVHTRIKPRNIPEFRIQRHDDVIAYLKSVADPRKNISPAFPLLEQLENQGFDIMHGTSGNVSNHSY